MPFIRVKTKQGTLNLELKEETRMCDLKNRLSVMTNINVKEMKILMGFPPQPLNCPNDNVNISSVISRNETLIVEECSSRLAELHSATSAIDVRDPQVICTFSQGSILRFNMPANNSCLFTSINFVVTNGQADLSQSSYLRGVIAEYVAADQEHYNDAFLGKSNIEYCNWIRDEEHWGGAIELSILCEYFCLEIAVIDKQSKCVHRFGQISNFQHRVFLMYNGSHYDAVALRSDDDSQTVTTVFSIANHQMLTKAKELSEQSYTEEKPNCMFVCSTCCRRFKYHQEMVEHATHTKHYHFNRS